MSSLKAAIRLLLFALWTIGIVLLQIPVLCVTRGPAIYHLPCLWHKGVCKIFGIKVTYGGSPDHTRQTVYVSNHLSYLDIPVIGSLLKASFVAKKDVSSWPVFGFLSKLQNTAFISRSRKDAKTENNALSKMVEEGKSLILFPEGTSTDGQSVRPFKSSLFSVILESNPSQELLVQPFTLRVERANGAGPQTQEERDYYAWHIEMENELPTHLWRFAKGKGAHIHLHFHPAQKAAAFSDRKSLALECHENVLSGLHCKNMGSKLAS